MADTKEILTCPACGSEMKKIFSKENNFHIDICLKGCGGIFFDNRELKKLDEKCEDISFILNEYENKEFKKVDESQTRVCPNCGMNMVKNFSSANREIEIDECYGCGGTFLDHNELERLRNEFSTEEERSEHFKKNLKSQIDKDIENELQADMERQRGSNVMYKMAYNAAVKASEFYFRFK